MAEIEKSEAIVLTIAGNDSSGNAGTAADSKTINAFGAHPLSVITAVTAQTSKQFIALNPSAIDAMESQLSVSFSLAPEAIKIGLITSEKQALCVAKHLAQHAEINPNFPSAPAVYDPVFGSTSGALFSNAEFIECIKTRLIPLCTVLTPNILEAEKLLGQSITTTQDVELAAQTLLKLGCKAVLIKGGHLSSLHAQDYFYSKGKRFWLTSRRVNTKNTRGTGCVLSSAIATALALGYSVYDAVVIGKMTINQGLRNSYEVAGLPGPLKISTFPDKEIDLPALSQSPEIDLNIDRFPACNHPKLDLYPVVDSANWLERLLPLGIKTVQLRIKNVTGSQLEAEIRKAIVLAKKHQCRLFINDYWQLAIKLGAYGVHLGQEDLDTADISSIRLAGLKLGVSTHCHYEVARAHAYKPSYIAVGPVFPTTTKDMPWVPHGINGFNYWRKTLDYPIVAIGGISKNQVLPLLQAGADSIAMITAITLAENPEKRVSELMESINEFRKKQSLR